MVSIPNGYGSKILKPVFKWEFHTIQIAKKMTFKDRNDNVPKKLVRTSAIFSTAVFFC